MNGKPIKLLSKGKIQAQGTLVISYEVRFEKSKRENTRHNPGVVTENIVSKQGFV